MLSRVVKSASKPVSIEKLFGGLLSLIVLQAVRAFAAAANIAHTPLYDLHLELKGKIVEFAGYALPVQYSGVLPVQKYK